MTCVSRWILVGTVACLGLSLGACSTMSLRGSTQSVAGDPSYRRPSYAGHRNGVSQQQRQRYREPRSHTTYPARPGRSQARVRYHHQNAGVARSPIAPRYNDPAPATLPQERSYALPPRVERSPVPEPERSVREAPPQVHKPQYEPRGWARWIGNSWRGHKTASGEIFDAKRLTGAHASLPVPSFVYVTNRRNGRTILIRINDRVPHTRPCRDRIATGGRTARFSCSRAYGS